MPGAAGGDIILFMDKATYKIGEVADRLATSIRTIRYYEEEGLLEPVRTPRGTRMYSANHIARLNVILRLAGLGFSLEAIRKIAEIRENSNSGDASSFLVEQHLDEVQQLLDKQINALQNIKQEIQDASGVIAGCHGCSNVPATQSCPDCPVINKRADIELLNLVWDTD